MRIRSIKPEFWRSEDIARLDRDDRLLFIGLWSYVDDDGVGIDRLAVIAAELFAPDLERDSPETFARVSRGLSNLAEAGLIVRYEANGKRYLAVSTWSKHQRVDKPNKPRYPSPDQGIATSSRDPREDSRKPREIPAPGTGEQGNRGTEEQEELLADLRSPGAEVSTALVLVEHPTPPASKRNQYPADFERFWDIYPRREKKGAALKAWERAKRRAPVETIVAGAARLRDDPNREPQYTAHPATWLNGDGWNDEPLPTRRPQGHTERVHDSVGEMWADIARKQQRGA